MLTILIFKMWKEKQQQQHIIRVQNDPFSGIKQSGSCEFHETKVLFAISLWCWLIVLEWKKIRC